MEQVRFLMTVCAFGIAALALLFSAQPAAAQDIEPGWARWKLDVSGDNGRVQAIWTVIVGGDDKGGNPVTLHEESLELKCRDVGDVGVAGDTLVFDGGYFECDFPDLLEEANRIILQHWGKECLLAGTGEGQCAPLLYAYAKADLTLKERYGGSLFRHPSIHFKLAAQSDSVQNYFYFGGEDSTGAAVPPAKQTLVESRYVWDDNDEVYFFEHFMNGVDLGKEKQTYQPRLHTKPATVYIGGDRSGTQSFQGSMVRLEVDPGCRVH